MKILGALCFAVPVAALAQNAAPAKSGAAKPAATQAAKAPAKKPAPKKPVKKKPAPDSSRVQLKSATANVAAGLRAADAALSPAELAIAERVHTGVMPCELGASVSVMADPVQPGYFDVQVRKLKYRMVPVTTSTGAIRLEDAKAGAVWLQIANKSMLMNQKQGQRLADECMSPQQQAVAEALKSQPQAPSLLGGDAATQEAHK